MRIDGNHEAQARSAARAARASSAAERSRVDTTGEAGRSDNLRSAPEGDNVNLTERAASLSTVKRLLGKDAPVRTDLVEAARADIASGRYQVDAERTAQGLIDVLAQRRA